MSLTIVELITIGTAGDYAFFKLTSTGNEEFSVTKTISTQFMHTDFIKGEIADSEEFYKNHVRNRFYKFLDKLK